MRCVVTCYSRRPVSCKSCNGIVKSSVSYVIKIISINSRCNKRNKKDIKNKTRADNILNVVSSN